MVHEEIASDEATRRFDWTDAESPNFAVVAAVADAKAADPLDITPLQRTTDTDALDSLFRSEVGGPTPSGAIRFEYAGYRVVLGSRGEGALHELDEPIPVGEAT